MSDTEDTGRKDPTARLETALERIAAAVARRKPAGDLPPPVTMEVAARPDTLIRQIRGVLGPSALGPSVPGPAELGRVEG